jgi:hypothetical protein
MLCSSTLTPVTIADIASRITGNTVSYTLKVVRARRDADADSAVPYPVVAGCLRPDKMVKDTSNTTTGAVLIVPASPRTQTTTSSTSRQQSANRVSSVRGIREQPTPLWHGHQGLESCYTRNNLFTSLLDRERDRKRISSATTLPHRRLCWILLRLRASQQNSTIYSVGQPATDGFIANSAVTSGRAGTVAGCLHLQTAQFAVGSRLFRLTDAPTNTLTDATTSAEKNYEASGLSVTQQDKTISSRSLDLRRAGPRTESMTINYVKRQRLQRSVSRPACGNVPCGFVALPTGCVHHVAGLLLCVCTNRRYSDYSGTSSRQQRLSKSRTKFFHASAVKDSRSFSKRPDAIRTSAHRTFDDASVYTRFDLPAPVYLLPGREYAIVLRSDSNQYTVYTAELGATVIGSDAKIGKQPYAGSFFKSQNASTWTESPFEDLMFRVNRACGTHNQVRHCWESLLLVVLHRQRT